MNRKLFASLWVLLVIFGGMYAYKNIRLETNILKLLPKYDSPLTTQLIQNASNKINDKLIYVVAGSENQTSQKNFIQQINKFKESHLFKTINYKINLSHYQELYNTLVKSRFLIMSPADRQASKSYPLDYFFDSALSELYGLTNFSQQQIQQDPLFFLQHILGQLSDYNPVQLDVQDEFLHKYANNTHYYIAFLQLNDSSFSPKYQQKVVNLLQQSKDILKKEELKQYSFGSIRYAYHAYEEAKSEISTVGLGSLTGIILLFLFTFRSLTPLIASTLALVTGIVSGFAATLLVFTQVHLFALVFGSTIAGVAIDYCFHYLSESLLARDKPKNTIKHILPGLLIGFASSAMVYIGFILTGYEVLAQISLFSIVGLLAVLLNVILVFPLIITKKSRKQPKTLIIISQAITNNSFAKIVNSLPKSLFVFMIFLGLNSFFLKANDDVRALQSLSPVLKAEEQVIRDLLGLKRDGRYVLLYAQTLDELLQLEQSTIADINEQVDKQATIGISDLLPTKKMQQKNHDFYKSLYASKSFQHYLEQTGLELSLQQNILTQLAKQKPHDWDLAHDKNMQNLFAQNWLGKVGQTYALALALPEKVKLKQNKQRIIVQQAKDASALFKKFRHKSIIIVAASALMLVLILAMLRYSWQKALHIVLIPFTAGLISLLLTQVLGLHISLFSVLSLLLVLGMGLDYVVFLAETKNPQQQKNVSFALMLSATTTVLSFGLLALSNVAVLQSFGFSVGTGIILVLLMSPAITQVPNSTNKFIS